MSRRVVVTGVGLVSAVGIGTEETWAACLAGKSGISPIRSFDPAGFNCRIAGEVHEFDPLKWIDRKESRRMGRFIQFAVGGSPELRSRPGRRTLEAGRDENSVVFTRKQQPAFEQLRDQLLHAQAAARQPQAPQPVDVAGQLAQMWQLVQQGAMTRHEFETHKARLLGQPAPAQPTPGPAPGGPPHPPAWR